MILSEVRRYPVKSMLGELLPDAYIAGTGIVGDRAHALVDRATGKVASAKDPRTWGGLLARRASYVEEAGAGQPILIAADGAEAFRSDAPDIDERLSAVVGRAVRLESAPRPDAVYDDVWPAVEGIAPEEFLDATETGRTSDGERISALPIGMLAPGTYQDVSPITVLTSASLRAARALHPDGDWDPRRFRANLLIDVDGDGFVENTWVGRNVSVGEVTLTIVAPTPRCVMTALAQEELPRDRGVLRTVAGHNRVDVAGTGLFACLGAYAIVVTDGDVAVGDPVDLQ